ncbi:hypothetical protein AVEN_54420-1 [Araneus ventricosus]|uniref:C2H2-type domain-containing protein n=1 Tax=Araneus ventricosus TaxID=182803 RepID=A0A4Y2DC09_ARAVE|nr:hypothetical protein AVEN_54420-1 [Araneus ventricosus]
MICCYLKSNNMQYVYEKSHQEINDIYCVVEERTGSKIVYRHCVCDKCYKRDSNQCNCNEICIQNDNQHLVSDLIKPCSVFIRRLDLLGHNGNIFSNCCLTFPEISVSEKSVTNKKVGKIEHGNSMAENGIENLSRSNRDSVRKQMDLLFESLCETFNLLRAKKKKYKETKKVDHDVFSSRNSGKPGIKNTSKEPIGYLHQGKNQITKTSKISKPCAVNSSRNYNISCLPTFKSVRKKFDEKENFKNDDENSRHSYEGTDSEIENEAPSQIDIKGMRIRYLSSSEVYTSRRTRACEIPKIDSGLFVDKRNNYSVPFAGSTTKIFSRCPEKSNQDKAVQAHDSLFSLNNSNPYCASNSKTKGFEKAENAFDKNREVEIKIVEEHIAHKNVKRTTKNYSVGKNVELISENSVYLSNHEIKSIEKADDAVIENSEGEIQILGEYIITRNFKKATNKCSDDMSEVLINENSHGSENEKYLEDDDSVGNKQMQILNKLMKPCSVFIELMDEKMINLYCKSPQSVVRDEANNCIPQMETVDQCKTDSCSSSSDLFFSSAKIHKISNRSTVGKFTARNEQTFKYPGRIPLIKPCSVVIDKLPFDKCLKFMNPTVINSFCYENASYCNVMDETESYISEEKNLSQCKINFCSPSPDCTISSTIVDEIPNLDALSKLAVINEQTRKDPRKTPLVKPCYVVIEKFSVDEKLLARKSPIKRQYNFLKFKQKNVMAFNRRRPWLLHKKNKLDKPFICKKWKKKPKVLKQTVEEWEKDLQVKEDLSINNCINVDKVSSTLLRENQHICYTSSDISPKCLSSNFRTYNCCVLLNKLNGEDLNVNKVSSMLLNANQEICNTSSGTLCTCPSSNLATNDCFVLLERINVDEYLVDNKNLFNNQYDLKCSTSSDVLRKCPVRNFRIHDCSVLLERINLDEYLAKNKNIFNQYDLSIQSENLTGSKHGIRNKYNRYKIEENFVPNSRLKLKRGSPLRTDDFSKLNVKKLKRITDYCTLEKTVKSFETVGNHSNLICDSDYKCVQCRKSITSDVELYHHLCCGKRKKGYICDICEKIFETIPRHKKHLNYHYKFIS